MKVGDCAKKGPLPLPSGTTAVRGAVEFAEAAAGVEAARKGVVAAVFTGFIYLEATLGFGDSGRGSRSGCLRVLSCKK